ncbi:MAG: DUF3943 domain-containing protein, partial [Bacteroidota bacterium]|nr:DUF3943 domain-containing protein [Bacteroidota bacterium]
IFLLFSAVSYGQVTNPETGKVKVVPQDTNVKVLNVPVDTNSKKILVKDTLAHLYNQYHGLLNDDPIYNKKYPWWQPALKVVAQNVLLNLFDHYVLDLEWSRVGINSWKKTATAGFFWSDNWKWDLDRFGNNFFLHPLTGAGYFNAARASGYNFYESMPFVLGGSYMWKMLGETAPPDGKPEREDIINTTILGIFGGEVTYRLSSNILDDRTTGSERFGRELLAGLIAPGRFLARLLQGKVTSVTTAEVYQKEPLDIVLSTGAQVQGTVGHVRLILNADFEYGDPFEQRNRKPYDYFLLRTDVTIGEGRKVIDNITGEGIIYGKNMKVGNTSMLIGVFQHYDYWDSYNFELATVAFSGGILSKLAVAPNTNLYSNLHIGFVPFAGNSRESGPDTTQSRDYYFSMGAEAKLEVTLNYQGVVSATLLGYYYWLNNVERPLYVGRPQNDFITVLKPRIEFHLFNNVGIGFEHLIYVDNRNFTDNSTSSYTSKTQEKLFLLIYLADFLHNR